ncbi:MAG: hypothetical protein ACFB0C_19010 [Leptolyngbyaceae cyanobacterium]
MNNDADALRRFLLDLLAHFGPTVSLPSGSAVGSDERDLQSTQSGLDIPSVDDSKLSADPALPTAPSTYTQSEMPPIPELGDLPAVQSHFQTVLKRRLQSEIEQTPPLFPWETELQEYPIHASTPALPMWLTQLQSLRLPTALPDDLLVALLERCQGLAQEALQPGVKLVQAVESIFPEQPQAINQIAGLVLAGATRDGAPQDFQALEAAFPEGYDGANPHQQVTLAMLAAQDIFDALTLKVTAANPVMSRHWQTSRGLVTLTATYEPGAIARLHLSADLPAAGHMSINSLGETVTQTGPGVLNLMVSDPESERVYALEVGLGDPEGSTLNFALMCND